MQCNRDAVLVDPKVADRHFRHPIGKRRIDCERAQRRKRECARQHVAAEALGLNQQANRG